MVNNRIMTEIIKLQVRIEIEYDETNPKNRKEAIKMAKENVEGIRTYGSICVKPLTSKFIK